LTVTAVNNGFPTRMGEGWGQCRPSMAARMSLT